MQQARPSLEEHRTNEINAPKSPTTATPTTDTHDTTPRITSEELFQTVLHLVEFWLITPYHQTYPLFERKIESLA